MKKLIGPFIILAFVSAVFGRAEASVICPNLTQTLRKGSTGGQVSALQKFLADYPGMYPEAQVTGYFGSLTEAALQRFQAKHGIASSGSPELNGYGLLGPKTRAMITVVCGELNKGGVAAPSEPRPTAAPTQNDEKKGFYAPTLQYFDTSRTSEVSGSEPQMELKVNGGDTASVSAGSDVTLSWTLSPHKWWYCGKLRDWTGSMTSPISGSEVVTNINYQKVFKLNCYVDNRSIEDEVTVQIIAAPTPTATPTPVTSANLRTSVPYEGSFGKIECVLRVKPADIIYMSETTPYARWETESFPTADWHFYWHESINGGPEQHVYGGKTQLFGQSIYNPKTEYYEYKPMKIKRYAHIVIDQKHYPDAQNPIHPEGSDKICTTNEVEFEIKESRTSSLFFSNFASLFNAIFPYINIGGYQEPS